MRHLVAILVYLSVPAVAWAGFDAGFAAYNKQDYQTALKEWRPLAEKGDARAQHNLGVMYANGQGVEKNYRTASFWYAKAAAQGDDAAKNALTGLEPLVSLARIVNYSPLCREKHPNVPDTHGQAWSFPALLGMHGPVKSVTVKDSNMKGNSTVFRFDVNGRVAEETDAKKLSDTTFEYDEFGRIAKIVHKDNTDKGFVTAFTEVYSYFPDKGLAVKKTYKQPGNKWKLSEAAVHETNGDGESVCFQLEAGDYPSGTKYVLQRDHVYFKQSRSDGSAKYPKSSTEAEADAALLTILSDLKATDGTECKRADELDPAHWNCYSITPFEDGDFVKYLEVSSGIQEKWLGTDWYDNRWMLQESASVLAEKLPDGTRAHEILEYEYDSHDNWVKQSRFIQTPPTITDQKPGQSLKQTVTRIVEYYPN